MVLVRTVFQVRQGRIRDLVEMMKQATQAEPNRPRILTDLSGPMTANVDQQAATNGERQQYTSDEAPLPASTASR